MKLIFLMFLMFVTALPCLAQTGGYEFSKIETQELPEVRVVVCGRGRKACYPGQPRYGCARSDLSEKAFKKACGILEEASKKYIIDCYVVMNGQSRLLGTTSTQNACDELRKLWSEVWTSQDHLIIQREFNNFSKRINFFQNNLMAKRAIRDQAVTANQLETNKKGKIISKSGTLRARILGNLSDYKTILSDQDCGPGVLPGIDKVPVLDQKQQGTCYAHSASSMLDYVRRFKTGGSPTYGSPLMAAIDYRLASKYDVDSCKNPFSGGFTCQSYNKSVSKGFCDTEDVEKSIIQGFDYAKKSRKTSWYLAWSKNKIAFDTGGFRIQPDDHVLDYLYVIGTLYQDKKWDDLKKLWRDLAQNGSQAVCSVDKSSLSDFIDWDKIQKSSSLENFYVSFFDGICQREPLPFKSKCTEHSVQPAKKVDEWLAEGYPLGIYYCSAILSDRKFKSAIQPFQNDDNCGPHASMVVGTARDRKGRCTYVVRNSWGKGCSSYDSDYDCTDGNIFIPKDVLLKQTFSIQKLTVE